MRELAKKLQSEGKTEQADVMKSGRVSTSDYEAAFSRLDKCVTDLGYSLSAPQINPVDGIGYSYVFLLNGKPMEAASKDYENCQEKYWNAVSSVYINTTEKKMDQTLWSATLSCLAAAGYPSTLKEGSLADLVGENPLDGAGKLSSQADTAVNCVRDNTVKLFPDLPSISVSF
ncbi:hypothetical protein ACIQTZ_13220 [Paenarthrobacter sp. NPDC090520]|uniref:hypothetical protein n=1 Tax=Paenarthrobacter sp. NPDC090520 TaxID=3364382 RepID=UPI0037F31C13